MRKFARRCAGLLLAAVLGASVLTNAPSVHAAPADSSAQDSGMTEAEKKAQKEKEEREKLIQKTFELPVQSNEVSGWPEGPGTYGEAAIVMDADTGAILYAKNIDKIEYPASITKVLTALLAYESGVDFEETMTVSEEAIACLEADYASIGLKVGDEITIEQGIHAMLMASANEVAYEVGETIAELQGHDYDWFLSQMNKRCKELGGKKSNFVNTNGVFDEKHVTCARDMALIGRALFDCPEFFEVCQTQQYTIPASDTVEEHVFQQHHRMLLDGDQYYCDYVTAGKTGYTPEAENTLITLAEKDGMRLVCVALKTYQGHIYTDTQALLDYGFDQFERVSLAESANSDGLELEDDAAQVTLPKGVSIQDLERKVKEMDSKTAEVSYYYGKNLVGRYNAVLGKGWSKSKGAGASDSQSEGEQGLTLITKLGILFCVLSVLMIIGIVLFVLENRKRNRRRRARRRRRRTRR